MENKKPKHLSKWDENESNWLKLDLILTSISLVLTLAKFLLKRKFKQAGDKK